ncbi:hypothetical protein J4214_04250 [Candidatus Woesearchaeota archaeon]|nr:hypothetical protein [Candidatus Woesearchaeota archaeon]
MCYIKDEVMNKLTILVAYSFDLFYALVRNSIIKPIFANVFKIPGHIA